MRQPVIGDIVFLKFYDHAQYSGVGAVVGHRGYIECEVYGRILGSNRLSYEIGSWVTKAKEDSINNEGFSVLKSTIIEVRVLRRK